MKGTTLLSDFLRTLGVPFTGEYSDMRFRTMPFPSLFGFSRLLKDYGIDSAAYKLSDKSALSRIPPPFLAQLGSGFIIVTAFKGLDGDNPTVEYYYYHENLTISLKDFLNKATGVILTAYPDASSREPDYSRHHLFAIAKETKLYLLTAIAIFMLTMGIIQSGIYHHLSLLLLLATDLAGLGVCWLLILKTLRIKSHAADKFCGVLQKHGCDTVLEQKASTFFGLFSWSEVGLTYFGVSTLLLLLFPAEVHYLALINGICLPFTIWSISYQKFVIKTWCTLCVTVQCTLWLQFFCFYFGGWWHDIFPLQLPLFEMGAVYVGVMLGLNRLMSWINTLKHD